MAEPRTRPFVLHVEDDRDDVELTRIAFREIGFPYEVVVAADGALALDFLFAAGKFSCRDRYDAPALVLLDVNLPKADGLEVLRRIKADPLLKCVPVVVLTSSNEETDRRRSSELGASLFIQKPANSDEFPPLARQIVELMAADGGRRARGPSAVGLTSEA